MAFHFNARKHCQNLRCKEMYSSAARDPAQEARVAEMYGTFDATAFWCQLTQTPRGPDDQRVNQEACTHGRKCFVGLENLS